MYKKNKITHASWENLGYRKVGPKNDPNSERIMDWITQFNYEKIVDSSGQWIRRKERRKSNIFNPPIKIIETINSSNFKKIDYSFIDKYKKSDFLKCHPSIFYNNQIDDKQIEYRIDDFKKNKNTSQGYNNLSLAIDLCKINKLKNLFINKIFPFFFSKHTNGEIIVYEFNFDFEKYYSIQRIFYSFNQDPQRLNSPTLELRPLFDWTSVDSVSFVNKILTLLNILFYPKVIGLQTGPRGLIFHFLFDNYISEELPISPVDWLDLFRSSCEFAKEKYNIPLNYYFNQALLSHQFYHKRFLHNYTPNISDIKKLIYWFIESASKLIYELTDPCNCITDSGIIDPIWSYENHLTVDRFLKQSISAYTDKYSDTRKSLTFEVADIIGSLKKSFSSKNKPNYKSIDTEFFKTLFNPHEAINLLTPHIMKIPSPFCEYFKEIAQSIYDELILKTKESIFIKNKLTKDGILIKNKNLIKEKEIPIDVYISNLMRSLRNAHHGYLSKLDNSNRPSRYLSITSGNIPDSISYLPILWWIAFLQSQGKIIGWETIGINKYD